MPRSADLPLPAATEARTANVTFSLGCAAVAPGALGDAGGRRAELPQVQVLRVGRERRRGGGRADRCSWPPLSGHPIPRRQGRPRRPAPRPAAALAPVGIMPDAGVPVLPGLNTTTTSSAATTATASTPEVTAAPARAGFCVAAGRRARRRRRWCGRRAARRAGPGLPRTWPPRLRLSRGSGCCPPRSPPSPAGGIAPAGGGAADGGAASDGAAGGGLPTAAPAARSLTRPARPARPLLASAPSVVLTERFPTRTELFPLLASFRRVR